MKTSPRILRERIRLEAPLLTPDGQGGNTRIWQEVATVWAQVAPMAVRETEAFAGLQMQTRLRALIRPREDITPAMRVSWRDTAYAIRGITPAVGHETIMELVIETGGEL